MTMMKRTNRFPITLVSMCARGISDLIHSISDPEHPPKLEESNVVEQLRVQVSKGHQGQASAIPFPMSQDAHCTRDPCLGVCDERAACSKGGWQLPLRMTVC